MTRTIDLNADMGEYNSETTAEVEAALFPIITSCSVACGGHTGDAATMRRTIRLAHDHNVQIGAHPSYPDKDGFGRRSMNIDANALKESLTDQILALVTIMESEGLPLAHVNPHGALYNDAARDPTLAGIIAETTIAIANHCGPLMLLGPDGSTLAAAAASHGAPFIAEGFVDRLYMRDGSLAPRRQSGAVLESIDARAAQAVAIATDQTIHGANGPLKVAARSLCLHSDTLGAVETAIAVKRALINSGISLSAPTIDAQK